VRVIAFPPDVLARVGVPIGFSSRMGLHVMKVGEVWFAWTEDPEDDVANKLRTKFRDRLLGLIDARATARPRARRGRRPGWARIPVRSRARAWVLPEKTRLPPSTNRR
jgi:hypothetical protein